MFNRLTINTARFCARLFICLQLLLPSTLSYAAPSYTDLASSMCAPSGQPLSSSAKAALKDLAELLGEESDDTPPPKGHCDKCTLSVAAILSPELTLCCPLISHHVPLYAGFEIGLVYTAQGPPTGSRAPPTFI